MPVFESALDTASPAYAGNRAHMLGLIARHDALRDRAAAASNRAGPRFANRGPARFEALAVRSRRSSCRAISPSMCARFSA